jgi:hypothetical protein
VAHWGRHGRNSVPAKNTAANVAAAEVAALERELQNLTAAGQLAGLVADRVADADYRTRLGVMTQIRSSLRRSTRTDVSDTDGSP